MDSISASDCLRPNASWSALSELQATHFAAEINR
jgi:hypothetical protein